MDSDSTLCHALGIEVVLHEATMIGIATGGNAQTASIACIAAWRALPRRAWGWRWRWWWGGWGCRCPYPAARPPGTYRGGFRPMDPWLTDIQTGPVVTILLEAGVRWVAAIWILHAIHAPAGCT